MSWAQTQKESGQKKIPHPVRPKLCTPPESLSWSGADPGAGCCCCSRKGELNPTTPRFSISDNWVWRPWEVLGTHSCLP